MQKPRIVVIDDEMIDRKDVYEKFLAEKFDIVYIGKESQLPLASSRDLKMIIIDLYLIGWRGSESTENIIAMELVLDELLRNKPDFPVIIVSKHWNDKNGKPIREILRLCSKHNVIQIFSWEEIANVKFDTAQFELVIDSWKNQVSLAFDFYQQRFPQLESPDETISLVQIADLQFGGEASPESSVDRYTIGEYLRNDMFIPKFVAVCGDIAQSGKPSEYKEAEKWFEDFAKTVWGNDDERKRFILTMGNHDANFDAFAQYFYGFDFESEDKKFTEKTITKKFFPWEDDKNYIVIENIVFQYFKAFEEKMSAKFRSVIRSKHLNIINDYFFNWGIRVLHINSLSKISPFDLHGEGISISDINDITSYCTNDGYAPDIFTIIVTHYGPIELGYRSSDTNKQNLWASVASFLSQCKVKLWLCGHKHTFEVDKIELDSEDQTKSIPYATVGSLRLSSAKIAPKAKIGFNKIELRRKDWSIHEVEITPIEVNGASISPLKKKSFNVTY